MTQEEKNKILEEAKLKYPVGCQVILCNGELITITDLKWSIYCDKIYNEIYGLIWNGSFIPEIVSTPKQELPTLINEDWCVKLTPENKQDIIDWGKEVKWNGNSTYYGKSIGLLKAYYSPWGKLLTTEEFYKKIGKVVTPQFEVGRWYKSQYSSKKPYYLKVKKIVDVRVRLYI